MKVAHQSFLRAVGLVPMYLRASETSADGSLHAGALDASMLTQPMARTMRVP